MCCTVMPMLCHRGVLVLVSVAGVAQLAYSKANE
jgi:hypothetical protein